MGIYCSIHEKSANYLVNLTDTEVRVYEDYSGSIWGFPPRRRIPTETLRLYEGEGDIYCIVDRSLLNRLKQYDVPLDYIALVSREEIGRKGKKVSRLTWAKDEETIIRLRNLNTRRG